MSLLGTYSEEYTSTHDRDTCTPMLGTTLFTAAKIRTSLKAHQYMTRKRNTYKMEFDLTENCIIFRKMDISI